MPEYALGSWHGIHGYPIRLDGLTAAAGRHGHHLIRLAGLVLIMAAVVVIAVFAVRGLIRRIRSSRMANPAHGADNRPASGAATTASWSAGGTSAGAGEAPAAVTATTASAPVGAGRTGVGGRGTAGAPAVGVRHLSKTYQMGKVTVRALDDVSLDIQAGTMVCILGRSGSGKSTLLRQLGLLDLPNRGRIWLNGREVTSLPEHLRSGLRLPLPWLRFPGVRPASRAHCGGECLPARHDGRPARRTLP